MAQQQTPAIRGWLQFGVAAAATFATALWWASGLERGVSNCKDFMEQHDAERSGIVLKWDREFHAMERRLGELRHELDVFVARAPVEHRTMTARLHNLEVVYKSISELVSLVHQSNTLQMQRMHGMNGNQGGSK